MFYNIAMKQKVRLKKRDVIAFAFRILFNSGNHLEWVCPWWLLDKADKAKQAEIIPSLLGSSKNSNEKNKKKG